MQSKPTQAMEGEIIMNAGIENNSRHTSLWGNRTRRVHPHLLLGVTAILWTMLAAAAVGACFQAPEGVRCIVSPYGPCPQGPSTPTDSHGYQCYYYCTGDIATLFGTCQPCYEPSYRKCEESGYTYLEEWIGKCTGIGICSKAWYCAGYMSTFMQPYATDMGYCNPY